MWWSKYTYDRQQQDLLQGLFHILILIHLLYGYKQPILDAN
jgi:hypothetical protein